MKQIDLRGTKIADPMPILYGFVFVLFNIKEI